MGIAVDLCIPELNAGDAISRHTLLLRDLLSSRGVSVRIVVERRMMPDEEVVLAEKWHRRSNTVVLQHGIGSQLGQMLIDHQKPIILNYHNITPTRFMEGWYPELAGGAEWGRNQLEGLAPITRRAIAVSEYNASELYRIGFRDIVVCPILCQLEGAAQDDNSQSGDNADVTTTLLFVGRVAPNKCHHDLIAALALLCQLRQEVELIFVGEPAPMLYQKSLEAFAEKLRVKDRLTFAGKVSDSELLDWYRSADVFVCVSEHEGFGVPLVEAMSFGLPIIAYDAGAVREIVGDAGIIVDDKRPANLAIAIEYVLNNRRLNKDLRRRGYETLEKYHLSNTTEVMWSALKDHLSVK